MKKPKKAKSFWPVPMRPVGEVSKPGEGSSTIMDVNFPVFGYCIGVLFADDVNKTAGHYFKGFVPEEGTYAFHFPFKGENRSMIFLPFKADAGTIAHEAYHAVRRMLEHIGIGLYEDAGTTQLDNEGVAYHLGYLIQRIHVFQKASLKSRKEFHAKLRNKKLKSSR